jgi:hypothetical protein
MSNSQLYLAIGIPMLFNAALVALLMAYINARFDGAANSVNEKFLGIGQRFDGINTRFDDMRECVLSPQDLRRRPLARRVAPCRRGS